MNAKSVLRWPHGSQCGNIQYLCLKSRRKFSSSPWLHNSTPIPLFTLSTDQGLNSLFQNIRTRLILPRRLSAEQQALIYKQSNIPVLRKERISVTVAGEIFQLDHLNRLTDIPSLTGSFESAIRLMNTRDWDNFFSLCAAYKELVGALPIIWMRKAIKRAAAAGRLDVIVEAARRGNRTGFVLNRLTPVRQAMLSVRQEALDSGWAAEPLKLALSRAEVLVQLMEREDHRQLIQTQQGPSDPRTCCDVVAVVLGLAAVRDYKYLGGNDRDEKVSTYAKRLAGTTFSITTVALREGVSEAEAEAEEIHALNATTIRLIGILHAVKMTEKVLGCDHVDVKRLKRQAESFESLVPLNLKRFRDNRGYPNSSLELYNRLLGADAETMITPEADKKEAAEGRNGLEEGKTFVNDVKEASVGA